MRSRAHRSESVSSVAGRLVAAAGAIRSGSWVLMGAIVVVSFTGGPVGGLVGLLNASLLELPLLDAAALDGAQRLNAPT